MTSGTQTTLLALVLVLGATPEASATDTDCPSPLTLWSVSENVAPGTPWSFRFLEIRDSFARNRLLEAWFAAPKISEEEARWFVQETPAAVPTFLSVRSHQYDVTELDSLCRSLAEGGIGAMQETAAGFCEAGSSEGDVRATARHADRLYGILARPRSDDERCTKLNKSSAARTLVIGVEVDADPADDDPLGAAARAVIETWKTFIAEWPDEDSGLEGLAALPAARTMVDLLMDLEAGRVPGGLRSDLHLAVAAGAPTSYTVALALEKLERSISRDNLVSTLLFLGDRPAPAAVDDLIRLLRRSREDEEIVGLALRALVKADPATARMEALRLLDDPSDVPSAALGVFALTRAGFDPLLEALDLEDHDAVCEAAVSLVNGLAASAGDDELRTAASDLLRRQAAGEAP